MAGSSAAGPPSIRRYCDRDDASVHTPVVIKIPRNGRSAGTAVMQFLPFACGPIGFLSIRFSITFNIMFSAPLANIPQQLYNQKSPILFR